MRSITENFTCPQHGLVIDTNITKVEWKEKYDELINFILVNHKFPHRKNATKYEADLNEYFTKEYDLYKMDEFADKRLDIFQRIVSLGDSLKKEKWVNSVRDILIFMLVNSRLPNKNSKDSYEKDMAKKMKSIEDVIYDEVNNKKLVTTLELNFNKIVIIFNSNRVVKEINNREKLAYLIILNGRLPDSNSENPLEAHIAQWVNNNITTKEMQNMMEIHSENYQMLSYRLDEEIKELQLNASDLDLTKHLGVIKKNPEKRIEHENNIKKNKEEDEKEWESSLKKYETFMNLMNRVPNSISKEKDEIKLLSWFDKQKKAYSDNLLPETRIKSFERVFNVYSKYIKESKRQKKLRKIHKGNYEVGY